MFQFKHLNRLIKSAFIAEVKASRITTLDALNAAFLARADTDYNKRIHSETGEGLVQNHGDFHPKNIIIGQDRGQDISTVFVSVIDFANTILFSPAFDVGYFVAQLRYQLREHPEVLERHSPERFVESYLSGCDATRVPRGFDDELRFFEARANMSIASFLSLDLLAG